MIFEKGAPLYGYEVAREAGQDILYVNYLGSPSAPSLADSPIAMARTVDALIENPTVSRVIFVQQHNYSHDFNQVSMLIEIANLYNYFVKQEKIISASRLAPLACKRCLGQRFNGVNYLILNLLKQDPIGCYVEARRLLREERINARGLAPECEHCEESYLRILEKFLMLLEKTALIKQVGELEGHHVGSREIYRKFFKADIIPNFTFTRLVASFPPEAEIVSQYEIATGYDKSIVTILKMPIETKYLYHLVPPEYALDENHYALLSLARTVLIEHRPKAEEFTDPERTRAVFFNISRDLLQELAETKRIKLTYRQLNRLATILVRHTIGFGVIEVLLQDEKLQDIVVNSPIGQTSIFVRHNDFDECSSNIIPSREDADSWAAKFRMQSGRPLDEANPVLDTDLALGKVRARVAVIQQPLSPHGIAYAFRRHREEPWTLPLFIKNKMLNPLAAGLLSFLIDGARTLLVAGTRSSGKTSLLGSLLLEIMPKYRVIVVED
ncbi:type II/IV secretion system ATPase subunit, partial [Candidatus Pacearchaeota archaeon]|nr:type II/IV secretion system ATPase subunit [Candidatus Pacearchaeota archaeon]